MTREELIAAVPVHNRNGQPYFIELSDIPAPWRAQFEEALLGSACPVDDTLGACAFVWDWAAWLNGSWYGRPAPTGLS